MTTNYQRFHISLLSKLCEQVTATPPFNQISEDDEETSNTLLQLQTLTQATIWDDDFYHQGQQLLCRFIAGYPHITPLITRDLLWLFGGDCLHYMPDEEIALFQALEERRFDAEANGVEFNYEQERANIFKLH